MKKKVEKTEKKPMGNGTNRQKEQNRKNMKNRDRKNGKNRTE